MSRSNMRGSVAGFVVVGAVLAALLLGGIYVVKTQLSDNGSATQTEVALDTTTNEKTVEETKSTTPDQSDSNKTDSVEGSQQAQTDSEQATDTNAEASEDAAIEKSQDEEEAMPATGVSAVEELPTTGPTETLGMLASFGILAGVIVYYRRSLSAKA